MTVDALAIRSHLHAHNHFETNTTTEEQAKKKLDQQIRFRADRNLLA